MVFDAQLQIAGIAGVVGVATRVVMCGGIVVIGARGDDHSILGMVEVLKGVMVAVLIGRQTFQVVIVGLGRRWRLFRGDDVESRFWIGIRALVVGFREEISSTRPRHRQIRGVGIVGAFRDLVALLGTLRWQSRYVGVGFLDIVVVGVQVMTGRVGGRTATGGIDDAATRVSLLLLVEVVVAVVTVIVMVVMVVVVLLLLLLLVLVSVVTTLTDR